MPKRPLYIIGAGSQSKVLLSMIQECGKECAGIFDDDEKLFGSTLWGSLSGAGYLTCLTKKRQRLSLRSATTIQERRYQGGSETLVGLSWSIRKPVYILQWKWGKDRPFSGNDHSCRIRHRQARYHQFRSSFRIWHKDRGFFPHRNEVFHS